MVHSISNGTKNQNNLSSKSGTRCERRTCAGAVMVNIKLRPLLLIAGEALDPRCIEGWQVCGRSFVEALMFLKFLKGQGEHRGESGCSSNAVTAGNLLSSAIDLET